MKTTIAALVAGLVLIPLPAAADAVGVAELLDAADAYDGREITLTGELIGDFQRRDEFVWTQLNDDPYVTAPLHDGGSLAGTNLGVAVAIPTEEFDAGGFQHPGGYRFRGPVVSVTGLWRYHDEARGGETYLAVTSLVVVEPERAIVEGGDLPVLLVGLALVALGLALPVIRRRVRRSS